MELVLGMLLGASIFGAFSAQMRVSEIDAEIKAREKSELPPPIPKEPSNYHSEGYHSITSYDNCGILEIQTYHYASNGCQSGFNLNLILELPYSGAKIKYISGDSYNMKFQVFNPENPNKVILLIAHWEYLKCGCMTWKWRVVADSRQYTIILDNQ